MRRFQITRRSALRFALMLSSTTLASAWASDVNSRSTTKAASVSSPLQRDDDRHAEETNGLFTADGRTQYLHCRGTGSPTVVFIAGGKAPKETWVEVPYMVAARTRGCVFDRSGVGDSGNGTLDATPGAIAESLHSLLTTAHVTGPLVLVGHSAGGATAVLYASRYPDDVSGLVLIDPTPVIALKRYALGREEYAHLGFDVSQTIAQLDKISRLPDVPMTVVSHDPILGPGPGYPRSSDFEAVWASGLRAYASKVTKGRYLSVKGAYHHVQYTHPGVIRDVIFDILSKVPKHTGSQ